MSATPNRAAEQHGVIVINVFTVRPDNQQRLIDTIRACGPADLPGLRSIRLLRSLDGTKVINHMHWDSQAAFRQATTDNPQVAELIEVAEPGLYEVVDP